MIIFITYKGITHYQCLTDKDSFFYLTDTMEVTTTYNIDDIHMESMNISEDEVVPSNIIELLAEVERVRTTDGSLSGANALLHVIRKHHFWPALQVKKFFHEPDLVLLHNTYKRVDVTHFKQLYDECRSVVLDMSAPNGQNIIVSYADHIPDRMVDAQYAAVMSPDDKCIECYEGTVVTVYNYNNKWYFGTSSCPSVNSSKFHHPNMSHGDMLNDALTRIFPSDSDEMDDNSSSNKNAIREKFTSILDPSKAYAFVLVHHINRHVIDYSPVYGEVEYAKLIHISTRDRVTLTQEDITHKPFETIGIMYSRTFENPHDAVDLLRSSPSMYGILVTTQAGHRYNVSRQATVHQEECDLGSPNKWVNMLWVFMQNRPDYHIQNYQDEFGKDIQIPVDSKNRPMSPTYLIYTCMCNMRDMLHQLYSATTLYYPSLKRFKMNKVADQQYHSIIRFHLAQLRHVQVQHHHHGFMTKKAIYHYLCFHQTLKNIRILIKFFAETDGYFTGRPLECFVTLNKMLGDK